MNVEETIAWIHSRLTFGSRLGLERMTALCEQLDNPQKKVPMVHVAGTNGKGSVVAFLSNMLQVSGLDVGTFTSPFIETFNDRICLNGEPIPAADLVEMVARVRPVVEKLDRNPELQGATEFEVITAIMFLYFAERQPDIVLVEVGLGGKYDSTNVIDPIVSVITSIGYDHMDILGNTLTEIAVQKAGIIKPNRPVFVGEVSHEARVVFKEMSHKLGAAHFFAGTEFTIVPERGALREGEYLTVETPQGRLKKLKSGLTGAHQRLNAGLAVVVFQEIQKQLGLKGGEKEIRIGLERAKWPGRFEVVHQEPRIILDGAHNEPAVRMLKQTLNEHYSGRKIKIIFGALQTKDVQEMLILLKGIPHVTIRFTTFDDPRAYKPTIEEQTKWQVEYEPVWQTLFAETIQTMETEDLLLFTGSLYFISEVRHFLKEEEIMC